MRYFIDTEYLWDAKVGKITPISLALVSEDGAEFYAQNIDAHPDTDFVQDHVWPYLDNLDYWRTRDLRDRADPWFTLAGMRAALRAFVGTNTPEFWGDYAAFDYVVLSMVMGGFTDWPSGWPMYINDLQQDAIPSPPASTIHHALIDARDVRDAYDHAFAETTGQ